LRHVKYP